MSCPSITLIGRNEYIGNSLETINDNFLNLKDGICYNDADITNVQQDIQNLDGLVVSLSASNSVSVSKALIKFSGIKDVDGNISTSTPNRYLFNSFNVSSVYRKNTGDYRIYFTVPLPSPDYLVLATNSLKASSSGNYVWSQPYTATKEYLEIKIQSLDGITADPDFVSLTII